MPPFSCPPIAIDYSTTPPVAQVTAIVFAYNQETVAGEAALSLLNQTILPAEIILSDDCSPDGTYEVFENIARNYIGPVKIIAVKNPTNFRVARHVNDRVAEASHDWILACAGDDVSRPDRLETFIKHQAQHPNSALFWSDAAWMSWEGKIDPDHPSPIARPDQLGYAHGNGPSPLWHKKLFSLFGPIPDYVAAEDTILPFRAQLIGTVTFIDQVLLNWRQKSSNTKPYYAFPEKICAYNCSSLRGQLADLDTFLKLDPSETKHCGELEKQIATQIAFEKQQLKTALFNAKKDSPRFTDRFHHAAGILLRDGPTRPTRNYILTRILLAPAALEDKIGRRTARLGALLCATVAAGATFLGIQHLGLPTAAIGSALVLICTYPAAILAVRTAIRLSTIPTPSP